MSDPLKICINRIDGPSSMRCAATSSTSYDGAVDSSARSQVGYGATPHDAVQDLVVNVLELPPSTPLESVDER